MNTIYSSNAKVPQADAMAEPPEDGHDRPSLPWRIGSSLTMGMVGGICRSFLHGLSNIETFGLQRFLERLEERRDVGARERGLLTVANHVSVLDDPLIWGVLPYRHAFNPENHRWSLGSYDLCFQNKALSTFFTLGQVLPTHRSAYSPYGGLFQPTMTQAIRILSSQPFSKSGLTEAPASKVSRRFKSPDIADPFTSGALTYSTNGTDTFPAPSYYRNRNFSWVHIFPEGRVHQHPDKSMRYFRWGVSRLILESEPLPEIIPIFIDGNQDVMHESREFPRFLPRTGKTVKIAFGDSIDGEQIFGDLRRKWKGLVELQREALARRGMVWEEGMGELTEGLKYNSEVVELRKEVTRRIRLEVLKVRKGMGYPDEDPKAGLVETWAEEGPKRELG